MMQDVAIVGVGWEGFRPTSVDYSYKELIYQAAVKAYHDANLDPRKDIESFVSVAEDFTEGTSIFDEYTADQLGAILKPMHTIPGESLHGLISAYLMIRSGIFNTVAVETHSKASNVKSLNEITRYALDPIYQRPLNIHPDFIAALEMQRFLFNSHCSIEDCSSVVQKNRQNAMRNPWAAYPAPPSESILTENNFTAFPLMESHISKAADGAIVIVLANADIAKSISKKPIWIKGVGWCNDSYPLEYRDWGKLNYVEKAAKMAFSQAQINAPISAIDFAEVDDTYAYRELMTLIALGFAEETTMKGMIKEGSFYSEGIFPVNVSGGSLGIGNLLDANGAVKTIEAVLQLRGDAGARQLNKANTALVQSWRGIPTTSTAVILLSNYMN
ncbi:MAG: thiolase C-terminal domain-containing protein [Anaerolineales bacterium]